MRRLRLAVVAAALLALLLVEAAAPAGAHAVLVDSSPGPGEVVGTGLERVRLAFLDLQPGADHRLTVRRPGGDVLFEGIAEEGTGGRVLSASFEAITRPGEYEVIYQVDSLDGDPLNGGLAFTVQEGAGEPDPLELPRVLGEEGGFSDAWIWVTGFVLVGAILGREVWLRVRS